MDAVLGGQHRLDAMYQAMLHSNDLVGCGRDTLDERYGYVQRWLMKDGSGLSLPMLGNPVEQLLSQSVGDLTKPAFRLLSEDEAEVLKAEIVARDELAGGVIRHVCAERIIWEPTVSHDLELNDEDKEWLHRIGAALEVTDSAMMRVYPPHQYECDWTGNGRSCMVCGLLEGGASHNLEPVKQCWYDAACNVVRVIFESGATGCLPILN